MPFYTQLCPECGVIEDAYRSVSQYKICEECGGPCEVKLAPVATIGIVWSNQETNSQIGTRWETNAQKRAWLKAHPNVVEMSKGDSNDRSFEDRLKNDANKTARKKGYRDVEDFRKVSKKKKSEAVKAAKST